jgi:hypothetical protein
MSEFWSQSKLKKFFNYFPIFPLQFFNNHFIKNKNTNKDNNRVNNKDNNKNNNKKNKLVTEKIFNDKKERKTNININKSKIVYNDDMSEEIDIIKMLKGISNLNVSKSK